MHFSKLSLCAVSLVLCSLLVSSAYAGGAGTEQCEGRNLDRCVTVCSEVTVGGYNGILGDVWSPLAYLLEILLGPTLAPVSAPLYHSLVQVLDGLHYGEELEVSVLVDICKSVIVDHGIAC